jgi:hypothetical protein
MFVPSNSIHVQALQLGETVQQPRGLTHHLCGSQWVVPVNTKLSYDTPLSAMDGWNRWTLAYARNAWRK